MTIPDFTKPKIEKEFNEMLEEILESLSLA
jgi:hypothetical protein